jgi:hypothetical protein
VQASHDAIADDLQVILWIRAFDLARDVLLLFFMADSS